MAVVGLTVVPPTSTLHAQETDSPSASVVSDDETSKNTKKEKKEKKTGSASFLPIPVLITEPAIGIGGGVALTYFHKKKPGDEVDRADVPSALALEGEEDTRKEKKPSAATTTTGRANSSSPPSII